VPALVSGFFLLLTEPRSAQRKTPCIPLLNLGKATAGELAVYHGVQGGRVFASALSVENPRVTRVVVEKSAFSLPPFKNIGVFESNLGE